MKELSIEEKAKAYDEAYKKVAVRFGSNVADEIFSQFEMSEDERIRKAIIEHFEGSHSSMYPYKGFTKKQIVAWLEKQGEQKPADKVEPKFREGDWVVYCNDDVDLITGIEENGYCINNGGYIPFVCENEMRLWNITDAKVGDVLVSESTCGLGTWYCIFKSLDGDESMTVYCYLTRDGRFETKKELCFDKDPYNTKPATKEQRDTLFAKMEDAGYTFDFDKKELKKIEGTTAWSEEDERLRTSCIKHIEEELERIRNDKYGHSEIISDLKESCRERINWLESLKGRVQPQNLAVTDKELAKAKKDAYYDALDKIEYHSGEPTFDDGWSAAIWYLKKRNAQPQTTWRPSEEQMNALNYVVNLMASSERPTENDLYYNILKSLRQQLKKLKE